MRDDRTPATVGQLTQRATRSVAYQQWAMVVDQSRRGCGSRESFAKGLAIGGTADRLVCSGAERK
jgi:hypothetical protein